ncbi:hypothetical protein DOY81_005918 [Sarcophaga bullata]|nr:hypothetical protein DOY81_005918 [Sarcophaga bullata]
MGNQKIKERSRYELNTFKTICCPLKISLARNVSKVPILKYSQDGNFL